jgi:quinone-modifying oxidoreductase subunit QmoC
MASATVIHPDTAFIKEVMAAGGGDLKKCYQCATCSVICDLSPEDAPFPRRQMIAAQWGLKECVLSDPAIWLCHRCGSCTTRCPRGARPGDVMAALRQAAIRHFAFPRFMGALVAEPRFWPLLFLFPALLLGAIALLVPKAPATAELEFANVFPVPVMEALFFSVSGLVILAFAAGAARFLKALNKSFWRDVVANLPPLAAEILTHDRFAKCQTQGSRRVGHLLTLWGFLALTFVGTVVGIGSMLGLMRTPLETFSPMKILANVSALVILAGTLMLLRSRLADPEERKASSYSDWFFLWTLAGVVITGIFSQFLRLAQWATLMYPVYFVHLVLILALFLYAPYSKFAHVVYRTVALAAAEPWKPKRRFPLKISELSARNLAQFHES